MLLNISNRRSHIKKTSMQFNNKFKINKKIGSRYFNIDSLLDLIKISNNFLIVVIVFLTGNSEFSLSFG